MTETPLETKDTSRTRRFLLSSLRMPRLVAPTPTPELRLRMRTKLVAAMVFAALVPVVIVALLATRVILSSLETGLREDADRQLAVGLNLVLRAVERLGDETVQLSESSDLVMALRDGPTATDSWLATQKTHIPAARLQLFDAGGQAVLERTLGSTEARFKGIGVQPGDTILAEGQAWTRGVFLVTVEDRVVMRAVAPVVDATLALRACSCCRPVRRPLRGRHQGCARGRRHARRAVRQARGHVPVEPRAPRGGGPARGRGSAGRHRGACRDPGPRSRRRAVQGGDHGAARCERPPGRDHRGRGRSRAAGGDQAPRGADPGRRRARGDRLRAGGRTVLVAAARRADRAAASWRDRGLARGPRSPDRHRGW